MSRLWAKWGLTFTQYLQLRGDKCPLCRKPYNRANRPAVVDHAHRTGLIRGVCCRQCNEMIGALRERGDWMSRTASWLAGTHEENASNLLGYDVYAPGSPGAAGLEVTK